MADDADRRARVGRRNERRSHHPEGHRAEAAPLCGDKGGGPERIDIDSYAAMIYRANFDLGLADAHIEYNTTPELRDLLAQAICGTDG